MTMYHYSSLILVIVAVVFGIAKKRKVSTELSMFLATIAAALAHLVLPKGVDPREFISLPELVRHIVEGSFTYLDVCLIFITATFFMSLLKEAGGISFVVRKIVRTFHKQRTVCLLLLTLLMLVPGALTGSGATTVLMVGTLVAAVLETMGVNENRRIAIVYLLACMSAVAPPVNLWAMMASAGANMPYAGFAKPLLILSVTGAIFTMFYLAGRGGDIDLEKVLKELPEAPEGWSWAKILFPFIILGILVLGGRFVPFSFPVFGLPLIFMISAFATVAISPIKLKIIEVASTTVHNLLGLVGIMIVVGALIQIMALTGARGLISLAVVTLPLQVLFLTLWLILPISEGLVQYAAAPLLGVPLIMLFNMKGLDPVISLSAWTLMWVLGDCLPPTAVVGRAAVIELDFKGRYYADFVKTCTVPFLFISLMSTLFLVFSNYLTFLGG